ncbi:MAG: hypothetical protein K8I27_05450 [Planctomycetes bacterium]|nr:hypothetical protein [Planctomycetota bacterium]
MDKKTKQLVILVVLIVVAGGVAVWRLGLFGGDDAPPPAPAPAPVADAGTPTPVPTNPTGEPTPAQPGGAPGQTPLTQNQDLDIPAEVTISPARYQWPIKRGGATDLPDRNFPVFDPLHVQNIDVVDPDRKKYIEQLRAEWILDGITVTTQQRLKIDATGKPMLGESIMEPKPQYVLVPQLDENKQPVYGADGQIVMVKQPVYEMKDGKVVMMDDLDDEGNPRRDESGKVIQVPKPEYVQAVDKNGNPKYDNNGEPVWEMQEKYRDGRRVVKMVPLILPRQVIVDGQPQFDDNGKPVLETEQVYEPMLDRNGKPVFENGEPVYIKVQKKDEDGKPVVDENGKPVMVPKKKMVPDKTPQTEVVEVIEAWFTGKPRPFRELDRLTNTRFTIEKIFTERVYQQEGSGDKRVRSGVDLLGDTGARITLFLADDSRHD